MKKPSLLMQIVIASSITIMSVLAIANATTIGTNISTSGTLTVTGVTTLGNASSTLITNSGQSWLNGNVSINGFATTTAASGNFATEGTLTVSGATTFIETLTMNGIATSTSALVASSTLRVFGTTFEGTGTFIETIDQGTDVLGYTDSNGINFKKNDGTLWGSFARASAAGGVNILAIKKLPGDYGAIFSVHDINGDQFIEFNTWQGLALGKSTVDTASTVDIKIWSGDGSNTRYKVWGKDGSMISQAIGGFGVDPDVTTYSAQLTLASSTSEQLRLANDAGPQSLRASFTVNSSGDLTLDLNVPNATTTISDNLRVDGNFTVNGLATTTSVDGNITTAGNLKVATTSAPDINLAVGPSTNSTTTIDFAKPCFRMTDEAGNLLYYYPSSKGTLGGWATSTTSCY